MHSFPLNKGSYFPCFSHCGKWYTRIRKYIKNKRHTLLYISSILKCWLVKFSYFWTQPD